MDFEKMTALARKIGAERAEVDSATVSERAAKVNLLNAAIHAIEPALSAMASRLAKRQAGHLGNRTPVEIEWHDIKGVRVSGIGPGVPSEHTIGAKGKIIGTDLFLAITGNGVEFLELTYDGEWLSHSRTWQWSSSVTLRTVEEIASSKKYNFADIFGALADALESQELGARTERIDQLRHQAIEMEAFVLLLDCISSKVRDHQKRTRK